MLTLIILFISFLSLYFELSLFFNNQSQTVRVRWTDYVKVTLFSKRPPCQILLPLDFLTSRTLKGSKLRKVQFWRQVLISFYRGAIESIMTGKIMNWHGSSWPRTGRLYSGWLKLPRTSPIPTTEHQRQDRCLYRAQRTLLPLFPMLPSGIFFLCSIKEFSSVLFSSPGVKWLMN